MTSAIIVASGSSRRMGFDKLTATLEGKPVLQHAIEAFAAAQSVDAIVVVCPDDRWQSVTIETSKPVTRVDGGSQRQDSVVCGLAALDPATRWVAVHDGARPLLSPQDIDRCVAAAREHRAAALARRATETMKRSNAEGFCSGSVEREHLWCMETPQVFDLGLLLQAYKSVVDRGLTVTDEVSAVQALGAVVKFVESRHPNLKVTTPADLALAAALLKNPS